MRTELRLLLTNMNIKEQIELWATTLKEELDKEHYDLTGPSGGVGEPTDYELGQIEGQRTLLIQMKKFLKTLDGEADRLKGYNEGLKGSFHTLN